MVHVDVFRTVLEYDFPSPPSWTPFLFRLSTVHILGDAGVYDGSLHGAGFTAKRMKKRGGNKSNVSDSTNVLGPHLNH